MDLVIKGADDLGVLAKRLKEVGDKTLRKELLAGIRVATKGTKAAIKANALSSLPARGGLAAIVANSKVSTKTRTTGAIGIRITAANPHSIRGMDRGNLRHPVFGNRGKWVSQKVKAGWFTDPIEADAPNIRYEIGQAMSSVAAKLERN